MSRICCLLCVLCVLPAAARADQQADLLKFIVRQNDLGRDAIRSATYDFTWRSERFDEHGRAEHDDKNGRVARCGNLFFSEIDKEVIVGSDGPHERVVQRVVTNEDYSGFRQVGEHIVERFDHASPAEASDEEKDSLELATPPDVLSYAYGDGRRSLRDSIAAHRDMPIVVTEENAGGQHLFHVKLYRDAADVPGTPDRTYTLDANKGFMVIRFAGYTREAQLGIEVVVEAAHDAAQGVWFPTKVTDTRYHALGNAERRDPNNPPSFRGTHEISNLVVNKEVARENFLLPALELHDGDIVSTRLIDGKTGSSVFRDGQYIPLDADARLHRSAPPRPRFP